MERADELIGNIYLLYGLFTGEGEWYDELAHDNIGLLNKFYKNNFNTQIDGLPDYLMRLSVFACPFVMAGIYVVYREIVYTILD